MLQALVNGVLTTLQNDSDYLKSLPDINSIKLEASKVKRLLLEKFHSQEHIDQMSFEDKRTILHFLFDGKDKKGTPYGIYISKTGNRNEQKIDYFMYGKIIGVRTLKGDDPNHDDNNNYKTNKVGIKHLKPLKLSLL
jgi:hypothetical protein